MAVKHNFNMLGSNELLPDETLQQGRNASH